MDRQDLGMSVRAWRVRMDVQLAEQTAERLVLIEGELLVAEEDHLMRHQRVVHFLELLVAQRLRQVGTENLRTDCRGSGFHLDRLIGHGCFLGEVLSNYPPHPRLRQIPSRQNPPCDIPARLPTCSPAISGRVSMASIKRQASAVWDGSGKDGKGNLTTQSATLKATPYSFNTRFGDGKGTNPE